MAARAEIRPGPDQASEVPQDGPPGRWVFPLGQWHSPHAVRWHVADAALAVGLLAAVVTLANLDRMPQGLEAFLAVRVSVKNVLLLAAFGAAWPAVMMACGLYSPARLGTGNGEWPRLMLAGAIGCALAMVFPLTSRSGVTTPWQVLLFGAVVVPAAGLLRASVRAVDRNRHRTRPRQVVLVGSGPLAARLYQQLLSDPFQNISVLGYVDSEPHAPLAGNGAGHLGTVQDLEQILMHRVVDDVIIGLPVKSRYDEIRQSLAACARVGVPASYSADLFGGGSTHPSAAGHAAPVLSLSKMPSPELLVVKRAMDVAGAAVLLVALSPVMLGVAVAIKLTSRGPVLFAQDRYGYMKRLFRMYKFRTMRDAAGANGKPSADAERLMPLGRWMRKWSLDELPELYNILTGDMSLVGPRPLLPQYLGRYTAEQARRHEVKPGITGWAQVNGRNAITWEEKFALDVWYVDNRSFWLDLKILAMTAWKVLRREGISAQGEATMPEFIGTAVKENHR